MTVLIDADERLFGPYWSIDAWFLMFLPLATHDASGETVPRLARSWERAEGGHVVIKLGGGPGSVTRG